MAGKFEKLSTVCRLPCTFTTLIRYFFCVIELCGKVASNPIHWVESVLIDHVLGSWLIVFSSR